MVSSLVKVSMKKIMLYFIMFLSLAFAPQLIAQETVQNQNWNPSSGGSINKDSDDSGQRYLVGAALGATAGYALYEYGTELCSTGYGCAIGGALIGMGVAALTQSASDVNSADQNNDIACQTGASGCSDLGSGGGPGLNAPIQPFENKNVKVDPKNKKIKDKTTGKEYNFSDFGSPAAMAAAGISKDTIDKAMAKAKEIEKNALAKLAAEGGLDGMGGGGGGGAATTVVTQEDAAAGLAPGNKRNPTSMPPSLAGLSKNFNGTPIGVSADDIFKMMNRRYQLKDRQDSFLGNAEVLQR